MTRCLTGVTAPPGVAETAAPVASRRRDHARGTARARRRAGPDRRADPGAQRVLAWCSPSRRSGRGRRPRRGAGRRRARPARCTAYPIAIKEEIDVAGTVTTFGGEANSHAGRRRRRGGPPAARRGRGRRRQDHDAGVRRLPLHRVRLPRRHPQPVGPDPHARRLQRRYGGRGGRRAWSRSAWAATAAARSGSRSACCGLFGLKPQRGRVTTAPHPHLWWALGTVGPLTRSVLDSALVYDVIRGNVDGDLYRAGDDRVVRRGRRPRARPAADRLVAPSR